MKRKAIAISLAISLLLASPSQQADDFTKLKLPDMGDSSGTLITPIEEKELGEAFFRSLHSQITISQDPEIQQYIQSIGEKLVSSSDLPNYPFHFFVIMENDVNAFAGPGGYVGTNSGLILITEAESELASVLAHEIAHVSQRHLYRSAESAQRMTIPTIAATLAAILLGSQSPALGQAALIAIQAGSVQFQINFTREHEAEADRVGMQTLAEANFDPRSMPTFFERLQQSTRFYGQNVPEFLRTHPVTVSRISDTRGRSETYPYKQYPDSLAYQLTKAKLRVLTASNLSETASYFQMGQKQGTEEQKSVARYGLGLVALSQQRHKDAEAIFQQLSAEYPNESHFEAAFARTALDAKDYTGALKRFQKLADRFPDNQAIKLEFIGALLKTGHAEQAKKNLLELDTKTQKLPMYWELLAQAYGELNQPAESHRYMAEYYYASGRVDEAILQIKLAQQTKGLNFQLSSILQERLSFFVDEYEKAKRDQ